jgi:membrane protein
MMTVSGSPKTSEAASAREQARGAGAPGAVGGAGAPGAVDSAAAPGDARGSEDSAKRTPPRGPAGLTGGSWLGALRRTVSQFRRDNLTDMAAALTYYGILSIFPALIALVSVLGLIGHSATQPLIENLGSVAPGPAKSIFTSAIRNIQHSQGAAGAIFAVSLAGAIWSASGYVSAFMRASNAIYDVEEGRPIWKTIPVRIGVTIVMLILLAVSALAVVLTGGLARQVGDLLGVGSTAVSAWDIAKWPVLLVIVSFMFALLYWAAPNVKHPGLRWLSPGGLLAVVVWVIASAGFALYVAGFSSYNKTYGAVAAVVVFLVWLWISNIALLLGAELNAELERGRSIQGGHPADRDPFLEPRDTRKMRERHSRA